MQSSEFTILYETHFKRVYNYISYRIYNHADTDDLVSEVFLRVMEKYETYNPQNAPLEAWIIGIANIVADYFRKQKRYPTANIESIEPFLTNNKDALDPLLQDFHQQQLMQALNNLSERERHIIALKYAAELKNKDIAEILDLSESNVGVILFRSLDKLQKQLIKEDVNYAT